MKNLLKISSGHLFSEYCPNYVTEIQFFSDGWNLFFSNQEFNAVIEPEVVSCS